MCKALTIYLLICFAFIACRNEPEAQGTNESEIQGNDESEAKSQCEQILASSGALPGMKGPIKDLVLKRSEPVPVKDGSATAGPYSVSLDLSDPTKGKGWKFRSFDYRGTINGHPTRALMVLTSTRSGKWDLGELFIYDPEYVPPADLVTSATLEMKRLRSPFQHSTLELRGSEHVLIYDTNLTLRVNNTLYFEATDATASALPARFCVINHIPPIPTRKHDLFGLVGTTSTLTGIKSEPGFVDAAPQHTSP